MDPVWVSVAVPESIVWLIKDASQFAIQVPAWPGKTFSINKWTLLPSVDSATRTPAAALAKSTTRMKR